MTQGKDAPQPPISVPSFDDPSSGAAPVDEPAADGPPAPARAKPRRPKKFSLPDHHHEEAAGPALVAFLDSAPTARPAARRARRFTLPDHSDEELGERIEAFIDGSPTRRRRATGRRPARRNPPEVEALPMWTTAIRREAARQARYGRQMAVLVIVLGSAALGSVAAERQLVETIGQEIRETDRVARAGVGRIFILLPETSEEEASQLASRIERGYRLLGDAATAGGEPRIVVAMPHRGTDPMDAIADAERRLSDAWLLDPGPSIG